MYLKTVDMNTAKAPCRRAVTKCISLSSSFTGPVIMRLTAVCLYEPGGDRPARNSDRAAADIRGIYQAVRVADGKSNLEPRNLWINRAEDI